MNPECSTASVCKRKVPHQGATSIGLAARTVVSFYAKGYSTANVINSLVNNVTHALNLQLETLSMHVLEEYSPPEFSPVFPSTTLIRWIFLHFTTNGVGKKGRRGISD